MLVNALLSRKIVASFMAASRIGSDVSADVFDLRQRHDSMSASKAHGRENGLMPFVRRILYRSQSGSIVMNAGIHNDASSKPHQSIPTSSLQKHTNLYPVPPAEGKNWSMRPVSTSTEAISVLKCLASIPSSMAPPHVEGFKIVVMYLSRGALHHVRENDVPLEME